MKQYFLKPAGAAALLVLLTTGSFAQPDKNDNKKHGEDVLIIKQKGDKDAKLTIEINGADIKVNGKPLSEFKDDDVSILRRKQLFNENRELAQIDAEQGYLNDLMAPHPEMMPDDMMAPKSRFRGGTIYRGNRMPAIAGINSNRAILGVSTEKTEEGVAITNVSDESAAEKAGLKEGDIITKINDTKIESPEQLTKTIGKFKPEEKITITYKRDKKEQKTTAALKKRNGPEAFSFSGPGGNLNFRNFNLDRAPGSQSFSFDGFNWSNKAKLGIKAQETEDGKGIKVLDVDDESPADKAGIKEGDIITEFDGAEVNNVDKLRELAKAAMDKVDFKIKLNRDGKQQELEVKIPKNLKTTDL